MDIALGKDEGEGETDNERQFTARLLQQLTDVYGIKHIYSSPYNPRGNSVVESYMHTLKITLKLCTPAFRTDWDVALQAAALAYRATPHTVTGDTPLFLVTGQEVVLPLSREWHETALCPLGVTWLEALRKCRVEVIKAHELAAGENVRLQTSETSRLRPGNHVALRLTKAERQAEGKFSPLFKGPHAIVNVNPAGVTADIRCLATGHMATVNRCRLKFLEAIPQQALRLKHLPRAVFCWVPRSAPPGGGRTDADVPTQPASHAPRWQRPKDVRSRSRVSGSASKLKLLFSSESCLRAESDPLDLITFFFSRAQRGLSSSPTARVVSAATREADSRRSSHRAAASHCSLVFSTIYREATALQRSSADPVPSTPASSRQRGAADGQQRGGHR